MQKILRWLFDKAYQTAYGEEELNSEKNYGWFDEKINPRGENYSEEIPWWHLSPLSVKEAYLLEKVEKTPMEELSLENIVDVNGFIRKKELE